MIKFIYYFDNSIKKTVFCFLSFKGLTYTYLVKTCMTHNRYLTFLFFQDNYSISAKSAAQVLSLKSHRLSFFEFFNCWFM